MMEENIDIYENLPNFDIGSIDQLEQLQERINVLEAHIAALESDIEKLCSTLTELKKAKDILTNNLSALFKTAKAEIERKDRRIVELQRKLDQYECQHRLNMTVPVKRYYEDTPNYENSSKKYKRDDALVKTRETTPYNKNYFENRHKPREYDNNRNRPNHRLHPPTMEKSINNYTAPNVRRDANVYIKGSTSRNTDNADKEIKPKHLNLQDRVHKHSNIDTASMKKMDTQNLRNNSEPQKCQVPKLNENKSVAVKQPIVPNTNEKMVTENKKKNNTTKCPKIDDVINKLTENKLGNEMKKTETTQNVVNQIKHLDMKSSQKEDEESHENTLILQVDEKEKIIIDNEAENAIDLSPTREIHIEKSEKKILQNEVEKGIIPRQQNSLLNLELIKGQVEERLSVLCMPSVDVLELKESEIKKSIEKEIQENLIHYDEHATCSQKKEVQKPISEKEKICSNKKEIPQNSKSVTNNCIKRNRSESKEGKDLKLKEKNKADGIKSREDLNNRPPKDKRKEENDKAKKPSEKSKKEENISKEHGERKLKEKNMIEEHKQRKNKHSKEKDKSGNRDKKCLDKPKVEKNDLLKDKLKENKSRGELKDKYKTEQTKFSKEGQRDKIKKEDKDEIKLEGRQFQDTKPNVENNEEKVVEKVKDTTNKIKEMKSIEESNEIPADQVSTKENVKEMKSIEESNEIPPDQVSTQENVKDQKSCEEDTNYLVTQKDELKNVQETEDKIEKQLLIICKSPIMDSLRLSDESELNETTNKEELKSLLQELAENNTVLETKNKDENTNKRLPTITKIESQQNPNRSIENNTVENKKESERKHERRVSQQESKTENTKCKEKEATNIENERTITTKSVDDENTLNNKEKNLGTLRKEEEIIVAEYTRTIAIKDCIQDLKSEVEKQEECIIERKEQNLLQSVVREISKSDEKREIQTDSKLVEVINIQSKTEEEKLNFDNSEPQSKMEIRVKKDSKSTVENYKEQIVKNIPQNKNNIKDTEKTVKNIDKTIEKIESETVCGLVEKNRENKIKEISANERKKIKLSQNRKRGSTDKKKVESETHKNIKDVVEKLTKNKIDGNPLEMTKQKKVMEKPEIEIAKNETQNVFVKEDCHSNKIAEPNQELNSEETSATLKKNKQFEESKLIEEQNPVTVKNRAKRRLSDSREKKVEEIPETSRVLRSASKKKETEKTNLTIATDFKDGFSSSTINLTHEGDIPVLHISDSDTFSNDNIFDLNLSRQSAITSSPLNKSVNIDLLRQDLDISLDQSQTESKLSQDSTAIDTSSKNSTANSSTTSLNMSRKRRRVVLSLLD